MENKRLGGGIIIISTFYLVSLVFGINVSITSLGALEQVNTISIQAGMRPITALEVIISIILSSILLIGIIFILLKRKIGIYVLAIGVLTNIIYLLIQNGLKETTITTCLLSLVIPAILFFFIYKRKEIYGLKFNRNK